MSSENITYADKVLHGLVGYLESFNVYNSDVLYNFYKEKVFKISYDQILEKLSVMYGINKVEFDRVKLNHVLRVLHKKYREYEIFYRSQRDLEANMFSISQEELDKVELTLERYTAAFMRNIGDLKSGFNLFLIVEEHQKFFRQQQMNANLPGIQQQQQPQQKEPADNSHVTMNLTNIEKIEQQARFNPNNTNLPKMTPEEFMRHLNSIKDLIYNYFNTNLDPSTKYQLELRLQFLNQ